MPDLMSRCSTVNVAPVEVVVVVAAAAAAVELKKYRRLQIL